MATIYTPATNNKQQALAWKNSLNRANGGSIFTRVPTRSRTGEIEGAGNPVWFTLISTGNAEEAKVQIVDGTDSTNEDYAGYAQVNDIIKSVPQLSLVTTSTFTWVYLLWVYDPVTRILSDPILTADANFPQHAYNELRFPIAKLEFSESSISNIIQIWNGGYIYGQAWGEC